MDPEVLDDIVTEAAQSVELLNFMLPHGVSRAKVGPLRPLLTDRAMRSVLSMMVRSNEHDQSYQGAWAIRHWYEHSLDRIVTKKHQSDVRLLLDILDGKVDPEKASEQIEMIKKQFAIPTV